MIETALFAAIAAPLAAVLALALRPAAGERAASRAALAGAGLSALASAAAIAAWAAGGFRPIHTPPHVLFARDGYRFEVGLVLDGAAAVFLALVQFVAGTVTRFSRFYLHREPGFQRFFANVLLFQAAMVLLTLAGNLDLMFAAWEMVGLSSFLLIAFYRERPSAVRNALKTYSAYRIADIGMLLAAGLEATGRRAELGMLVLLAAMGKSAQVPLSFWMPRAMEGPTPSSALFYGALSVHAGAYLLLRTFDLWGGVTSVRVCVGVVGVATALLCSAFSRVQPTIKAQLGYASVAQVGLVFLEIALGLRTLALAHVVGNALLRCYQLLVSPSIVAQRLRRQASAGAARSSPARAIDEILVPAALRPTLYVLAISDGYFKEALKAALWFPAKRLGEALLPRRGLLAALAACAAPAALALGGRAGAGAAAALIVLSAALSACGLALWRRPAQAMTFIAASGLSAAAAVAAAASPGGRFAASFYAVGVALAYAFGLAGLIAAAPRGGAIARFSGLWASRPVPGSIALVGALGIAGFPLMPTFWGEDLLVHAALGRSRCLVVALAVLLAFNGYLAVRVFAFAFFGRFEPRPPGEAPADSRVAAGQRLAAPPPT